MSDCVDPSCSGKLGRPKAYICRNLLPPICSKWHGSEAVCVAVVINELAAGGNRTTYNANEQNQEDKNRRRLAPGRSHGVTVVCDRDRDLAKMAAEYEDVLTNQPVVIDNVRFHDHSKPS